MRQADSQGFGAWTEIGFIPGAGTSAAPHAYRFVDNAPPANAGYRLRVINADGTFRFSSSAEVHFDGPINFVLYQNHPNPFNPSTVISFELGVSSNVSLKVFDLLGREVETLVQEKMNPGEHEVRFDATRFASGIYFYRLKAEGFTATKKLLLLK